jgi:hypothetical protein
VRGPDCRKGRFRPAPNAARKAQAGTGIGARSALDLGEERIASHSFASKSVETPADVVEARLTGAVPDVGAARAGLGNGGQV